jgi:hypothetical protein
MAAPESISVESHGEKTTDQISRIEAQGVFCSDSFQLTMQCKSFHSIQHNHLSLTPTLSDLCDRSQMLPLLGAWFSFSRSVGMNLGDALALLVLLWDVGDGEVYRVSAGGQEIPIRGPQGTIEGRVLPCLGGWVRWVRRTWWQALLQLLGLVVVLEDKGVEVTLASDLELDQGVLASTLLDTGGCDDSVSLRSSSFVFSSSSIGVCARGFGVCSQPHSQDREGKTLNIQGNVQEASFLLQISRNCDCLSASIPSPFEPVHLVASIPLQIPHFVPHFLPFLPQQFLRGKSHLLDVGNFLRHDERF